MDRKHSVITFKADEFMMAALEKIPNKSEFIRAAILAALDETCPFCSGTGILNPHQKVHWSNFLAEHHLTQCKECNGVEIHCIHHEHDGCCHPLPEDDSGDCVCNANNKKGINL